MTYRWIVTIILLVLWGFVEPAFAARAHTGGMMQSYPERSTEALVDMSPKFENKRNHKIHQSLRERKLPSGVWGGEHIRLEVSDAGATVEYDCAHAAIPAKIVVNRLGRFLVMGTHLEEHGGPVRETEPSNGYPVQFVGRVSGKKLQLTVRRRDSKKLIGIFTLFYGQEGSIMKCR